LALPVYPIEKQGGMNSSMTNTSEKPLITFALFAYNQERFIREAVEGAFSQTYSPLEIILSDDCSPDRTFEIMEEMVANYSGPHTIVLNRNERNLGLIGHINLVMGMVKGELIVGAAGDDVSLPHRTTKIFQEYFKSKDDAYSIFSNATWIDSKSRKMNLLRKNPVQDDSLKIDNYAKKYPPGFVNGATHAWHREVFAFFGPLPNYIWAEDTTIPFRSAILGKILYIHDPLVLYRRRYINSGNKYFIGYSKFIDNRKIALDRRLATYKCRLEDLNLASKVVENPKMAEKIGRIFLITESQIARITQEIAHIKKPLLQQLKEAKILMGTKIRFPFRFVVLWQCVREIAIVKYLLEHPRSVFYYNYQNKIRKFR
jgi:glycosyltransferase involved in cell wall biosynthesis